MKKILIFINLLVLPFYMFSDVIDWTQNTDDRIQGLATVWSEVKFGFPYPEKLDALDWNGKFLEYLPRVMAAQDADSYYNILMELSTLLNDSHTAVLPPWEYFKPGWDMPPVEIRVIDGRFYVVNREETPDILDNKIEIGTEILKVDGVPVRHYFNEHVLKYHTQGSPHGSDAFYVVYLLYGPADVPIELDVRDRSGLERTVVLKRNSWEGQGPLIYEFAYNSLVADKIGSEIIKKKILYIKIPSFEQAGIMDSFLELIDRTDLSGIKGMIIDLRHNTGGSSRYCNAMVGALVDEPVSTPLRHVRYYSSGYKAWNKAQLKDDFHSMIQPRDGKRYIGPMVVLINAVTNSTAEDMAIELKSTGRATIVGEPSCGGAGNTLTFDLPGGGYFRMATFKATWPDGTEYIGKGIQPDVVIVQSIDDIVNGKDTVLENAVKLLK